MKINAVITKRPRTTMSKERLDVFDRTLIAIFGIMLVSVLSGALVYRIKSNFFDSAVFDSFVAFSTDLTGKSFFEAFSGFFAVDLSMIAILTILGTSSFGRVPILATAAFRVVGVGVLGTYLFDKFGVTGLKYFLAVIIPGRVFMFFALLLSVQNCVQCCNRIRLALKGENVKAVDYKVFLLRNLVAAALFALAALVDALLLKFASQHFLPQL